MAKFYALPLNKSVTSSVAPFDVVYFDVWGPSSVSSKGGSYYYVSFVEGYTHYTWVYLMKCRSYFFTIYSKFRSTIET